MLELFTAYSVGEVVVFIILLCLAIKEGITFYDWAKTRIQQGFNKNLKEQADRTKMQHEIDDLEKFFEEKEKSFDTKKEEINNGFKNINQRIDSLAQQVEMLIASDKDNIKAYITEKHHKFCYQDKWIDDYSLDCLEKRYGHYKEEGGNSFIEDLMIDLRNLDRVPPQD